MADIIDETFRLIQRLFRHVRIPYTIIGGYAAGVWGLSQPTEVALIGDAATVSGEIKRLEDLGVTDLCGYAFQADADAFERTVDFLGSLP